MSSRWPPARVPRTSASPGPSQRRCTGATTAGGRGGSCEPSLWSGRWTLVSSLASLLTSCPGLGDRPRDPDTLYAGIEVGGVYKSTDGGETFKASSQGLYEDIHSWPAILAGQPSSGPRPATGSIAATTGPRAGLKPAGEWPGGMPPPLAWSLDGAPKPSLPPRPPRRPGTGPMGPMQSSSAAPPRGGGWEPGMGGLPQTLDGVPVAFASSHVTPGRVYAGVASGELLASDNLGRSWYLLAGDQPSVQAVLCAPPRLQDRLDFGESGAATEPFGPNSAPGAHPCPDVPSLSPGQVRSSLTDYAGPFLPVPLPPPLLQSPRHLSLPEVPWAIAS